MIDIVLLVGRILLVVLLYVFLFAVMKTGIGLVKGQRSNERSWSVNVERGPKELRGVKIQVQGPIIIGRAPGADILIPEGYVSGRHARLSPMGKDLMLEDLGSRNGTFINGQQLAGPQAVKDGDIISVGDVEIRARFS